VNKQPWWQACTCYQIYLPSFCDGNGDGLGDFPGLLSKVDYLSALGIGAIWITPFYPLLWWITGMTLVITAPSTHDSAR
jgi:trehalose-6-phosphate hydrolase